MTNKKENKFIAFFKRHKVFSITLFLFLVALPLILIPTTYIVQVVSTKPVLFDNKDIKAVKAHKQDFFDIVVELNSIKEPIGDALGEYVFDYKLTPKTEVNIITNLSLTGQLAVINDDYSVFSDQTLNSFESSENNKLKFSWDYNMKKSVLPLLKPRGPKLFLQISFTYQMGGPLGGGPPMEETIYVEVQYT